MGIVSAEIRPRGLFAGRPLWAALPHSRNLGLQKFLSRDTGAAVFYKKCIVHGNRLYLSLRADSGAMSEIGYLKGIRQVHIGVRQEELEGGRKVKVLYGWRRKEDFGIEGKVLIRYVLAEKKGRKWHLFKKPEALTDVSEYHQRSLANQALTKAVTQGLGNQVLRRTWTVGESNGRVSYALFGRPVTISGFGGRKNVFSLITEEEGKIVSRFYPAESDADRGQGLLKTAILSEKSPDGKWVPKEKQKLFYVDPSFKIQYAHLLADRIRPFLLEDQDPGASLDIGERKVVGTSILLNLDNEGIPLAGFSGHRSATGTIISGETEKNIFFWPDEEAKKSGAPSIIPQGQTLARRIKDRWEIVWYDLSWGNRMQKRATLDLAKFVFCTAAARVRTEYWPVKQVNMFGHHFPMIIRTLRGTDFRMSVKGVEGLSDRAASKIREFGRRIKLVEYWPNDMALVREEAPFAARFIAFNQNGNGSAQAAGGWVPFWHPADSSAETIRAFRGLIKERSITMDELRDLLTDDYFINHDYPFYGIFNALDHSYNSRKSLRYARS